MSPKTRRNILVAILVLLALLIAFLLWWFLRSKPKPAAVVPPVVVETPLPTSTTKKPTVSEEKAKKEQAVRVESASLQSASKTFAERYGSYSTEANFANLTDVLPLMTVGYASRTRAYVASATSPTEYYGVTTRVITVVADNGVELSATARTYVTVVDNQSSAPVIDSGTVSMMMTGSRKLSNCAASTR